MVHLYISSSFLDIIQKIKRERMEGYDWIYFFNAGFFSSWFYKIFTNIII